MSELKHTCPSWSLFGPSPIGYEVIRFVVGFLFLCAAVLKGHALMTEPFVGRSATAVTWAMVLLIALELIQGWCLLANVRPRVVRSCAIVFVALFAVVSLTKVLLNVPTCGCLGDFEISPMTSLAADIVAGLSLLAFAPAHEPSAYGRLSGKHVLGLIAIVVLAVVDGSALSPWMSRVAAWGGQQSLSVENIPQLAADASIEEVHNRTFVVRIHNRGEAVRTLLGGRGTGCFISRDLPLEVPPRTHRDIRVIFLGSEVAVKQKCKFEIYVAGESAMAHRVSAIFVRSWIDLIRLVLIL